MWCKYLYRNTVAINVSLTFVNELVGKFLETFLGKKKKKENFLKVSCFRKPPFSSNTKKVCINRKDNSLKSIIQQNLYGSNHCIA